MLSAKYLKGGGIGLVLLLVLGLLLSACGDTPTNTAAATQAVATTAATSATTAASVATTAASNATTAASSGAPATGDPILIGAVLSVTGANAPLGAPQRNSLQLAEEQLNKKGGINGRPVKLIILDDESKDDLAAAHIKKLVNDEKVVGIIGSSGSGPSLAMAPIANELQTPMISMGSNIKLVEPVTKWVFKTPPNDSLYFNHLFDFFKEKNWKKIGFIHDANAYGTGGKDFLLKAAPEKGFEVVAVESFDGKAVDMKTQLTKIQAAKPDVIVCWGTNPGPAIVTKNRSELGIEIPLFQGGGAANQQFLDLAGDAANGVYITAGKLLVPNTLPDSDPLKPLVNSYLNDYKAKFNAETNQFGSFAWDAFNIMVNAIQKGGVDKAKIRDAIEATTNFPGTQASYSFSATDHNGLNKSALVMILVKDRKWSFVSEWK
jgi:branched-chain amino acid transport system substrate-binding protein